MPSTYTDILGLELQETGENLNSWGLRLNQALRLVDDSQNFEVISLTGNLALSNTMNQPNQARKAALAFTDGGLSAAPTVTLPPVQRLRYVENRGATYAITFTAGGVAGILPPGRKALVLCNGTDVSVVDWVAATDDARIAAQAARDIATNASSAAISARDKAQLWANAPEDQAVELGKFSAFHWMRKALGLASDATTQANRSKNEADRAQGYADGLNLPAITPSVALQFLRANTAGNAFEFAAIDVSINRSVRTSNIALAKADKGALIDITSGTFTQTFAAAATLGAGWFAYLRNAGTGDITLDPSGSETIDGLASFIMYPGEVRLIQCDGTALRSLVLSPFYKVFTASENFVRPPGYKLFRALAWSGGASGRKNSNVNTSTPGGPGGGCFPFEFSPDDIPAITPITIGAGGAPMTADPGDSNPGGDTLIGSSMRVFGAGSTSGGGMAVGATASAIGFEGPSRGTNPANALWGGSVGGTGSTLGGSSVYGGGHGGGILGGGSFSSAGTSSFAGNGGQANYNNSGNAGSNPSGGGGSTRLGAASGAGGRGEVRIWGAA